MRSKHISRRDFYLVAKFVDEFFMKNSHPNLCWQQLELTISWFLRLLSLPLFDNDFFRRSQKYSFKSPADTTRVLMHLNRASDIIIMEINCSLELSDARAALKPQGLLKQLWNCSTQKVLHVKALKINHRCRYFKRHRIFYHDSASTRGCDGEIYETTFFMLRSRLISRFGLFISFHLSRELNFCANILSYSRIIDWEALICQREFPIPVFRRRRETSSGKS